MELAPTAVQDVAADVLADVAVDVTSFEVEQAAGCTMGGRVLQFEEMPLPKVRWIILLYLICMVVGATQAMEETLPPNSDSGPPCHLRLSDHGTLH